MHFSNQIEITNHCTIVWLGDELDEISAQMLLAKLDHLVIECQCRHIAGHLAFIAGLTGNEMPFGRIVLEQFDVDGIDQSGDERRERAVAAA